MKRQVGTRLQSTSAASAEAKSAPPIIRRPSLEQTKSLPLSMGKKADGKGSGLRKGASLDSPRRSNLSAAKLVRVPSHDATISPLMVAQTKGATPKPITIGQGNVKISSPKSETKSLYHAISPELLSVSPLQPSPSMALLNRTAEVLLNGEHAAESLRRMPVHTTTQVFEVRAKPAPPGPSTRLSRQESLLAVFKPATDEEDSLLVKSEGSFRFGAEERALRERAAYVLDRSYQGFSRVPATALARVQNNNGSLQEYVKSNGTAEDNPELVGQASAEEVQRIAILDCRILNLDRHSGNVLVSKESSREKSKSLDDESGFLIGEAAFDEDHAAEIVLTPIDHSLSLPPWRSLGEAWFDWCYWPQADEALTEASIEHILSLDVAKDEKELIELGIKPDCVVTYRICTMSLKALARKTPKITLKALAQFYQRPYSVGHKLHHIESPLEHLVNEACARSKTSKDDVVPSDEFFKAFESILSEQIETDAWRSYVV